MNRMDQRFHKLKKTNKTAFIPFITVGDPDLTTTLAILYKLQSAGADMIELGVPYSDPLADGPVIQKASERALRNGITILDVIHLAKQARTSGIHIPLILFTYYNPLLQAGFDTAFSLMKENEINGVIIPDLPVEESGIVCSFCTKYQIHYIPLVAPTSKDRIHRIVNQATGFVYCVSSLGVTGQRTEFYDGIETFITSVKEITSLPVAVGFGISKPDQFKQLSLICDGVVVGSAIVQQIEENLDLLQDINTRPQGLEKISEFVADLIKSCVLW